MFSVWRGRLFARRFPTLAVLALDARAVSGGESAATVPAGRCEAKTRKIGWAAQMADARHANGKPSLNRIRLI